MNTSEREPADLMPACHLDAGASLRRMLHWDICAHTAAEETTQQPPPRMRSATMETEASSALTQEAGTEHKDGLDEMIKNAQRAWDNLWSKHRAEVSAPAQAAKERVHRTTPGTTSRDVVVTFDTTTSKEQQQEQENEITMRVVVTEPGTSRAMRVYRGLELFLLAIFVLGMTLRLLQRAGVEFNVVLESNPRDVRVGELPQSQYELGCE